MPPAAFLGVVAGNCGPTLGAAKRHLGVVLNMDNHLAYREVKVDRSDLPGGLDAEDLGIEVFVLHGGYSRRDLLSYPHEIRKRQ
jgi:hypothetical protein